VNLHLYQHVTLALRAKLALLAKLALRATPALRAILALRARLYVSVGESHLSTQHPCTRTPSLTPPLSLPSLPKVCALRLLHVRSVTGPVLQRPPVLPQHQCANSRRHPHQGSASNTRGRTFPLSLRQGTGLQAAPSSTPTYAF
jgi:hypothetical protein